jgi:hypothetical protein
LLPSANSSQQYQQDFQTMLGWEMAQWRAHFQALWWGPIVNIKQLRYLLFKGKNKRFCFILKNIWANLASDQVKTLFFDNLYIKIVTWSRILRLKCASTI